MIYSGKFCIILMPWWTVLIASESLDNENPIFYDQDYFVENLFSDENPNHGHLRRELQATCRSTVSTGSQWACFGSAMHNNPCRNSQATCENTFAGYECECTDNALVSRCTHCQVRTGTSILCQKIGSSATFMGPDGLTTCQCDYGGNGEGISNCFPQIPPPDQPLPWEESNAPSIAPITAFPPEVANGNTAGVSCAATHASCMSNVECCSGRCVGTHHFLEDASIAVAAGKCRAAPKFGKVSLAGQSRGGAANGSGGGAGIPVSSRAGGGNNRVRKLRGL